MIKLKHILFRVFRPLLHRINQLTGRRRARPMLEHIDGLMMSHVKEHGKIGRNDKCPCGSGDKFKKCCHIVYDSKGIRTQKFFGI